MFPAASFASEAVVAFAVVLDDNPPDPPPAGVDHCIPPLPSAVITCPAVPVGLAP